MARMRTIKPEFWTDSKIVQLTPLARLLYIGMWNFALCDNGHVDDDPIRLKLQVLPMDQTEIGTLLDELFEQNRIKRITTRTGQTYLQIDTLKSHQKGDPRWRSRCPACKDAENDSPELTETPQSLTEPPQSSPKLKKNRLVEERRVEESIKDLSTDGSEDDTEKLFTDWYEKYPRKEAKGRARTAFKAALKKTSINELLAGLERYKKTVTGKDKQYIALPATWLNAERWEDDYTPQAAAGNEHMIPPAYRMFN